MFSAPIDSYEGRVVVTHGRSLHALAAAHSLAQHNIEVIGGDDTPLMALSFSRSVTDTFLYAVPQEGEEAYIDSLVDACQKFRPTDDRPYVLMPIHQDTQIVSRHKQRFEPWMTVAVPDWDSITQVDPKHKLIRTAQAADIPIPETHIVESEEDLHSVIDSLSYPSFIKRTDGTGGVGIEKVKSADALRQAFATMHNPDKGLQRFLVQEAIPGEDYCVTGLFQQGECRAMMTYRNLQRYPDESGFGILRETIEAEPLEHWSRELMKAVHWNGVAEIDFRWDGRDETRPRLIEVNPRFWGGLFHSISSGVDYPWLLYRMVTGKSLPESVTPSVGARTKVPMFSALTAVSMFSEQELDFQGLKDTIQKTFEQSDQPLLDSFNYLKSFVSGLFSFDQWKEKVRKGEGIPTEILSSDDPMAALGILYVIGSLVRTGQMPEEFTRSGNYRGPGSGETS